MNKVRKVGTVIDEEGRQMIADKVLIAASAVDLGCKAMCVAAGLCTADGSNYHGEASEYLADCTLL